MSNNVSGSWKDRDCVTRGWPGLGVSRTTVIKYVSRDYSPSPREGAVGNGSLVTGEYARAADEWSVSDLRMPRKQRHTARRVLRAADGAGSGFPTEYS